MVEKGTTMAIGSWERIHVAIGYAAVMYYIATRFYFSEEDLGGTVFGVVSDRCCLFFFSLLSFPLRKGTRCYIYIYVCVFGGIRHSLRLRRSNTDHRTALLERVLQSASAVAVSVCCRRGISSSASYTIFPLKSTTVVDAAQYCFL